MPNDYNRVILTKAELTVEKEGKAGGTITPGDLLTYEADGDVVVHATAGGTAGAIFAREDSLQGNGIDDNYTVGNRVQYNACPPGTRVYAFLAAGESVTPADFLVSNGDGTLAKFVADSAGAVQAPNVIVARPLETLDNSASGATDARIEVEVV